MKLIHANIFAFTLVLVLNAGGKPTLEWPFDRPPLGELRAMPKKVFIHYFPTFPISIDNRHPSNDYYQMGYLSPEGEKGKHRAYGGYFRQRPLPRTPRFENDWKSADLADEVAAASRLGVDGFAFDMLAMSGPYWDTLLRLLQVVQRQDDGFRIMLMPDMSAGLRKSPETLLPALLAISSNPSLARLPDGRLLIAPYMASLQPPEYWRKLLADLKVAGVSVALIPLFQGWWNQISNYREVSWGFTDWGTSTYEEQAGPRRHYLQTMDRLGLHWMADVRPQDVRPKNFKASESGNSSLFREGWRLAIEHNADFVQVITWNDYSEASEIAPSTSTRHAWYDLTAYYTTWFKTGHPPPIVRDALYAIYRTQSIGADFDATIQAKAYEIIGSPRNEIEALTLLREPATLNLEIGGRTMSRDIPAGLTSTKFPLVTGIPRFSIKRGGKENLRLDGAWAITNVVRYSDFQYHADGGTAEAIASRTYDSPKRMLEQTTVGEAIKELQISPPKEWLTFSTNPADLMLISESTPLERPLFAGSAYGAWAYRIGPGPSVRGGALPLLDPTPLAPESEFVFRISRLETTPGSGWISVFLGLTDGTGTQRLCFVLRNPRETYVAETAPQFKVVRGNSPVSQPCLYRIRRSAGKLQFIYNNSVFYDVLERAEEHQWLPFVYLSCQKEDSSVLLECGGISLRRLPTQ